MQPVDAQGIARGDDEGSDDCLGEHWTAVLGKSTASAAGTRHVEWSRDLALQMGISKGENLGTNFRFATR